MLAEIFMLKAEAAARVPSISRERTGQPFWRNLISAIADGRRRKADEYVKEYLERHAEDDERRR